MKKILLLLTLFTVCLFGEVATITAVKGKASILRDGAILAVSLGSTLENKDSITTQNNTKLQIIFKDETIINIGKNSNFSINEYLFEDAQEALAKFSILKGAVQITTGQIGKIAPQKFTVITKTSTIGIRGTKFTLILHKNGEENAYCTLGEIIVTLQGKSYEVKQGYFLTVSTDKEVTLKEFSSKNLKHMKNNNFKFSEQTSINENTLMNLDSDEEIGLLSNEVTTDINEASANSAQQTNFVSDLHDGVAGY